MEDVRTVLAKSNSNTPVGSIAGVAHGEFLRPVHQNLGDTRQLRNLLRQCDLAVVVDWDTGSVDEVRLNWMIG